MPERNPGTEFPSTGDRFDFDPNAIKFFTFEISTKMHTGDRETKMRAAIDGVKDLYHFIGETIDQSVVQAKKNELEGRYVSTELDETGHAIGLGKNQLAIFQQVDGLTQKIIDTLVELNEEGYLPKQLSKKLSEMPEDGDEPLREKMMDAATELMALEEVLNDDKKRQEAINKAEAEKNKVFLEATLADLDAMIARNAARVAENDATTTALETAEEVQSQAADEVDEPTAPVASSGTIKAKVYSGPIVRKEFDPDFGVEVFPALAVSEEEPPETGDVVEGDDDAKETEHNGAVLTAETHLEGKSAIEEVDDETEEVEPEEGVIVDGGEDVPLVRAVETSSSPVASSAPEIVQIRGGAAPPTDQDTQNAIKRAQGVENLDLFAGAVEQVEDEEPAELPPDALAPAEDEEPAELPPDAVKPLDEGEPEELPADALAPVEETFEEKLARRSAEIKARLAEIDARYPRSLPSKKAGGTTSSPRNPVRPAGDHSDTTT